MVASEETRASEQSGAMPAKRIGLRVLTRCRHGLVVGADGNEPLEQPVRANHREHRAPRAGMTSRRLGYMQDLRQIEPA